LLLAAYATTIRQSPGQQQLQAGRLARRPLPAAVAAPGRTLARTAA